LTSNIDNNFIFSINQEGAASDFVLSYVVFGPAPQSVCSSCQQKNAYANTCVNVCPSGTYTFTYKDGAIGCR